MHESLNSILNTKNKILQTAWIYTYLKKHMEDGLEVYMSKETGSGMRIEGEKT
jgi:hypothetical protein